MGQFTFSGTAPFIVLGAVMAGGDWGRGTITTAQLQRPDRARTFTGQALALAAAVTASVLATFAVAAAASIMIRAAESDSVNPYIAALPPALVIAMSVAAALLVALTYGMLGLFLGTVCRSGAIAAALLWTLIVEGTLYDLALQFPHGTLRTISDLTPAAAAATVVTGLFGDPGGGAGSQNYMVVSTAGGVWTLTAYMAAALALIDSFCGAVMPSASRAAAPRSGGGRSRPHPAWTGQPCNRDRRQPQANCSPRCALTVFMLLGALIGGSDWA